MAYQALYRKWRPLKFEDVLGQTAAVKTLRHQVESGRIGHAYLFCGCRGTGKTSMAKIMSRALNCTNPDHGDPCGECDNCRAILRESCTDVVEMDAASNSRVEEMRDLLEQVVYPPQFGKYKVYIIDEVHMLSNSAFNALLKTLEEPPSYIVFILATTQPQKVPNTILSRVQRYDFGRIPTDLMVQRMQEALADLGMTAEEEALNIVARSAEGAMRDAFSILDMCVSGAENKVITAAQTREMLGASDKSFLFDFFDHLRERDECKVMLKIDDLMRSGREPQVFLKEIGSHCRALLTVKNIPEHADEVLNITAEDEKWYRDQAQGFSMQRLLSMLDLFTVAEANLRYASAPRIGLESAALHACEEVHGEDVSALVARIAELETKLLEIEKKIAEGTLVAATPAPREASGEKKAVAPQPKAAVRQAEPPVGDTAIWQETVKTLLKNNPALATFARKLMCMGEKDGTMHLVATKENKIAFDYFSRQDKKEALLAALTATAGKPVIISLTVAGEAAQTVPDASPDKLFEVFGRENVQVVEGNKS